MRQRCTSPALIPMVGICSPLTKSTSPSRREVVPPFGKRHRHAGDVQSFDIERNRQEPTCALIQEVSGRDVSRSSISATRQDDDGELADARYWGTR